MTFIEVQKLLRRANMTIRKTPFGEYRVAHTPYVESEASYQSDLEDAVATARHMCVEKYDVAAF